MTAKQRKAIPISSGVLKYFPDAIKEVARVSKIGNDQHHPDKPLHWDKPKSNDHEDAMLRHLLDHQAGIHWDDDTALHLGKVAWRALAALQTFIDNLNHELDCEKAIAEHENNQLWDEDALEDRMRVIGQNGNSGLHYQDSTSYALYPGEATVTISNSGVNYVIDEDGQGAINYGPCSAHAFENESDS